LLKLSQGVSTLVSPYNCEYITHNIPHETF
jgi:hypothetical protein